MCTQTWNFTKISYVILAGAAIGTGALILMNETCKQEFLAGIDKIFSLLGPTNEALQ